MTTPQPTSSFGAPPVRSGLGITGLSDVDLLGAVTGDTLVYNATTKKWTPGGDATFDSVTITKGTVTQITSITTAVATNATAGVITTVASTLAAEGKAVFTLTNTSILATSVVLTNIHNYDAGAAGIPQVTVDDVAAGSCVIVLRNVHSTDALDDPVEISFVVH